MSKNKVHPCGKKKIVRNDGNEFKNALFNQQQIFQLFEAEILVNIESNWREVKNKLIEKERGLELTGGRS